ncbi:two pore domain potassium channel family protein [Streptomyces fradiae]|nr:two pore domain potassium channel family protein [Streptomyces fradiae]
MTGVPRGVRDLVTRHAGTAAAVLLVGAAVAAYFLLPFDRLGPHRPGLSWSILGATLAAMAVLILRQIHDILLDRPDTRSGLVIAVLLALSVLIFAACYLVLARDPGEFSGLETRVDALYFTLVTLATIGYGDITPLGQSARAVVVVQVLYSFVFLTAGVTALSRRVRWLTETRRDRQNRG